MSGKIRYSIEKLYRVILACVINWESGIAGCNSLMPRDVGCILLLGEYASID